MRLRNLAVIALVPILLPAAAHAQCEWQPGFHVSDLDSIASALVVYDDGAGPVLYVGGLFLYGGGKPRTQDRPLGRVDLVRSGRLARHLGGRPLQFR